MDMLNYMYVMNMMVDSTNGLGASYDSDFSVLETDIIAYDSAYKKLD